MLRCSLHSTSAVVGVQRFQSCNLHSYVLSHLFDCIVYNVSHNVNQNADLAACMDVGSNETVLLSSTAAKRRIFMFSPMTAIWADKSLCIQSWTDPLPIFQPGMRRYLLRLCSEPAQQHLIHTYPWNFSFFATKSVSAFTSTSNCLLVIIGNLQS